MTEIVNETAERELLGALLVFYTPELLASVRALLRDDDFSFKPCEITWRAVKAVADAGDHVDTLTVAAFLGRHRTAQASWLDMAGGLAFLQLLEAVAAANGVVERARIVAENGKWRRRDESALRQHEACEARDEAAWTAAAHGEAAARLRVVA